MALCCSGVYRSTDLLAPERPAQNWCQGLDQSDRNSIADLSRYLARIPEEPVIIWKRLQPSCLPQCDGAIIPRMSEAPARDISASRRKGWCDIVPTHAAINVRVARMARMACQAH